MASEAELERVYTNVLKFALRRNVHAMLRRLAYGTAFRCRTCGEWTRWMCVSGVCEDCDGWFEALAPVVGTTKEEADGLDKLVVEAGCDACGTVFAVEIDAASKALPNWSAYDMAVDAIRGGRTVEDDSCSVQEDKLLCPKCTNVKDQGAYQKAAELVDWLVTQKHQGKEILAAVVCCDAVSRQRFIEAIAELL